MGLSSEIINHFIDNIVITSCLSDNIKKKVPKESLDSLTEACKLIDRYIPLLFNHLIQTVYLSEFLHFNQYLFWKKMHVEHTWSDIFLCEFFSTDVYAL